MVATVSSTLETTQTIPVQPEPTFMGNAINWFRDPDTSLLLKIGAVALYVIATLAAGYVLDAMALTFSAVTIGMIAWILKELSSEVTPPVTSQATSQATSQVTPQVTQSAPPQLSESEQAFRRVKDAIGGPAVFDQLPLLNNQPTTPDEMSASMMRGEKEGRPFIALKIQDILTPSNVIVMILSQKQTGEWTLSVESAEEEPLGETLEDIRQFCNGLHDRYRIFAEPTAEEYQAALGSDGEPFWKLKDAFLDGVPPGLLNAWRNDKNKQQLSTLFPSHNNPLPRPAIITMTLDSLRAALPNGIPEGVLNNLDEKVREPLRQLFPPEQG